MRKRWTPQTEITPSLLIFREKRKWQIALRRYILEKNKSSYYAPFFALDSENLRKWIETQFDEYLNWDNFSTAWQFDHVLPVTYFDFTDLDDLRLCWNFMNISVAKTDSPLEMPGRVDLLAAKSYFEMIQKETAYPISAKLIQKINNIETIDNQSQMKKMAFLIEKKPLIENIRFMDSADFDQLNQGVSPEEIQAQKELIKKYGNP